MMVPNILPILS